MNPFRYGSTVSNEYFCQRPELEKIIQQHINSRQNIHIQGDRRTGKTSLVLEICRRLEKPTLLHADFLLVKSADHIRDRLIEALSKASSQSGTFEKLIKALAHFKPIIGINPTSGEPTLSIASGSMQPDERSITELLEFSQKNFSSRNLVIFFDEFQDILNVPDGDRILANMRSSIQQHHDCTYIYSGSSRSDMSTLFMNPNSPFYKSALPVPVTAIPRSDFIPFLTGKFDSGNRNISHSAIRKILDLAEDNPGDTQEICNGLWEITTEKSTLDDPDVEQALELVFSREIKYFEQILETITPLQKRCLRGIAALDGTRIYSNSFMDITGVKNTGSITKAVKQMQKNRIIHSVGKRLVFASPFLKLWLLRNPHV